MAVSLAHFGVDLLNGQRAVYLTFLSVELGLTNAALGAVSTSYTIAAAVMQPIFGYVTDKFGARWVIVGGVIWLAFFFSLSVLTPGIWALGFLVIASMGSGAFHPAGTMQATLVGRTRFSGRETTSSSYFFFLGQFGLFLGPMIGGVILGSLGRFGLLMIAAPAVPVALNALYQMRGGNEPKQERSERLGQIRTNWKSGLWLLVGLALLAASRSWIAQNMNLFIPKYLSDLGYSPALYGFIAALFMGGTATGNVIGGNLADRFGKQQVATISLGLATIPLLLLPMVDNISWYYFLVPLTGILSGASHSIIVVFAQKLVPGGMGLASGLILGFTFSSGSIGTLISGFLADSYGIPFIFQLSAGLALIGAAMAFGLRMDRFLQTDMTHV